jgi:hypothetical protein
MRVLVACEFSGRVRDAFIHAGHDAWSCDLLPGEGVHKHRHLHEDVLPVLLDSSWDLMIAHPPCDHIAVSGARWFKQKRADGRQQKAIRFFMALATAPIPRICVENPVCIMSSEWRKPDQIIQPWEYGHPEAKKTCLWLKNLSLLAPTNVLELPESGRWSNQTPSGQNKLGPSDDRWKLRSTTYTGIAAAMADQWGEIGNDSKT